MNTEHLLDGNQVTSKFPPASGPPHLSCLSTRRALPGDRMPHLPCRTDSILLSHLLTGLTSLLLVTVFQVPGRVGFLCEVNPCLPYPVTPDIKKEVLTILPLRRRRVILGSCRGRIPDHLSAVRSVSHTREMTRSPPRFLTVHSTSPVAEVRRWILKTGTVSTPEMSALPPASVWR